jgi:hypothetical protein
LLDGRTNNYAARASLAPQQGSNGVLPTAGIQAVAAGTATVTLGPIEGNPAASVGTEIIFNVTEAKLSILPFTLGRDLEAPVQLRLGSSVQVPTADVPITVYGYYPVTVALNSGDVGQNSIVATNPGRAARIETVLRATALHGNRLVELFGRNVPELFDAGHSDADRIRDQRGGGRSVAQRRCGRHSEADHSAGSIAALEFGSRAAVHSSRGESDHNGHRFDKPQHRNYVSVAGDAQSGRSAVVK